MPYRGRRLNHSSPILRSCNIRVTAPKSLQPKLVHADASRLGVARVARRSRFFSLASFFSTRQPTAQVTPAAGYVPPDDTPSSELAPRSSRTTRSRPNPKSTDVDGNTFTPSSFNIERAYLNVTGNISHIIPFRVTPDIARETGTGSSLNGSYTYRLKYAYAQFNLDDWMTRGSWARFGMQQTPWVDFMETLYRYRFQGTIFEDREGYPVVVGRRRHVSLQLRQELRRRPHRLLQRRELQPRRSQRPEGFMMRGTLRPLPRARRRSARPARHRLLRQRRLREGWRAASRHLRGDLRAPVRQRRLRLPVGHRPDASREPEAGLRRLLGLGHAEDDEGLGRAAAVRPPRADGNDIGDANGQNATGRSPASPTGSRTRARCRRRCCSTTSRSTTRLQPRPPERAAVGRAHARQFLATDDTDAYTDCDRRGRP